MKKALFVGALASALLVGGCSATDENASDSSSVEQEAAISDLTGTWSNKDGNSEDAWMEAVITDTTISIDWISDGGDTRWVYWVGTFDPMVEGTDAQEVVSERDTGKTSSGLLASSQDTKEFSYDDGKISYSQSALGQTTTIYLEKQSDSIDAPSLGAQEENIPAQAPAVEIVDSGFGQEGDYVRGVVVVTNDDERAVGEFVTASVNFLDTEGRIISTEEQVETFHWVGQELVLPILAVVDQPGVTVATMEPSVSISDYGSDPSLEPLPVLEATEISLNEYGEHIASFEFTNETGEDLDGLRIGVVCRDESGNINGGNSAYPNLAPAGRTIRIDADVTVSEQPASCNAHLNY